MINSTDVRHFLNYLLVAILLFVAVPALCQQSEEERQIEIEAQKASARHRSITVQLDSAIRLSEQGQYERADEKFKFVLKNLKSIPSDFTFHFGKNSFYLGKYKQSIDWLNKYVQLKGMSGQYSEEATEWLAKAEAELLKERNDQTRKPVELLSRDYNIDCGASGKVSCPVCMGSHVVIRKGYLKETYHTCPYCDVHGNLTCDEYNKLIRGQLKPAN